MRVQSGHVLKRARDNCRQVLSELITNQSKVSTKALLLDIFCSVGGIKIQEIYLPFSDLFW